MSSQTPLPPIMPVTADEPEAMSADPVAANLQALKALFPDAFSEGGVDFDTLRQLLGDAVDDGEEKYGLNWSGKRRARRLALTPSMGTLLPAPEDSVDWDTTKNLMIEGDNLEVLKLLQKSYAGKVKLIYIDPPYNTGSDFVYPDDYADNLSNYLRRTRQIDEVGVKYTTNTESSGRYHTDWLNMMLPRLMLARNLMRPDGLILINIGDEEVANLRLACESVFGEENFLATIAWQKKYGVSADSKGVPLMQDYILAFQRSASFLPGLLPRSEKQNSLYENKDNDARGPWTSGDLLRNEYRERDVYPITSPLTGKENLPPAGASWRHPQDQVNQMILDNRIWFGSDGNGVPRVKRFLSEVKDGVLISGWWPHSETGHTDEARKEVKKLMEHDVFQTPKPVRLLTRAIQLGGNDTDGIVLDFFAGSGTTAHAVMAQNAADGCDRRYILVQLPEPLDPENKDQKAAADFCDALGKPRTIAELTKERLRRAAAKVKADNPGTTADLGFRAYKLATSNLKTWAPGDDLEADLLSAADNLAPGRTEDDLLVELLLKRGIDLAEPSQTREVAGRTVHAFGGGVMLACLGDVQVADAEALADGMADWVEELSPVAPAMIFFKDAGFENDVAKTNVAKILDQRLNGRGPGETHLLEAVRSV